MYTITADLKSHGSGVSSDVQHYLVPLIWIQRGAQQDAYSLCDSLSHTIYHRNCLILTFEKCQVCSRLSIFGSLSKFYKQIWVTIIEFSEQTAGIDGFCAIFP